MDGLRALLLLCLGLACSGQTLPQWEREPERTQQRPAREPETTCLAAEDDALWIGTAAAGVFRMSPEGSVQYDASTGLEGVRVRDCAMSGGTVWVATEVALHRFDPASDRFESIMPGVFTQLATSERGLWASGQDGGVVRVDTDPGEAPSAGLRHPDQRGVPEARSAMATREQRPRDGG